MSRPRVAESPAGAAPPRRAAAIQRRLLRWYAAHRRRLPWRRANPDPYRVWVAETMLQQTQVSTVTSYYERFIARFPDLGSLAAADEEEVLALWSGLGYYSRARSLLRSARRVLEHHAGRLPRDRAALEALPGIGRYTAGAILSIAFGQPEPVVDGNVRRVLSRLLYRPAKPARTGGRRRRAGAAAGGTRSGSRPSPAGLGEPAPALLEAQARALVRGAPPGDFNQAIMELGALVCRPSSPSCALCPLATLCAARRLGVQDRIPPHRKRPPTIRQARAVALIRHHDRILVERAAGPGAPRGLWDLPGVLTPEGAEPRRHLERHLRRRGLGIRVGRRVASVEHAITFRRIRCTAYEAALEGLNLCEPPAAGQMPGRWVRRSRLASLPMGAAARRLLAGCLGSG